MLDRTVRRLIDLAEVDVQFLPIPEDARLVGIVDGYEYRPNPAVLGYVSLGNNRIGGTTRAPYGQGPDGRYFLTATTKVLINPDAAPDKQLQIIVVGMGKRKPVIVIGTSLEIAPLIPNHESGYNVLVPI